MKNYKLSFKSLLAVVLIFICTGVCWFLLGGALTLRSVDRQSISDRQVFESWGPMMRQQHPVAWYASPTGVEGRSEVSPSASQVDVLLKSEPVKKGLVWYRSYQLEFEALYQIPNPTPIAQTVYVSFRLPSKDASYNEFRFELEGADADAAVPKNGVITQAVLVPPAESLALRVGYNTRGLDRWTYDLEGATRIQNFSLSMETDFEAIDFPEGTASPTSREISEEIGWSLDWDYPDVIGARSIGMEMPGVLNPGPIASRISFFAPVSLLFYFAVLLILGAVSGVNLHPMNYFFLAAGSFSFQLLFAYTVDVLPIHLCFIVSAIVSLVLVSGYLHLVGGRALSRISVPAQFAYMILFSYSFFFEGYTGLTITVGAVMTLALLMVKTARIDWGDVFTSSRRENVVAPPPLPND